MYMKGVLVGCDQTQEKLLHWWWKHYVQHNTYPVMFIDFGMSDAMRAWCEERGSCMTISQAISLYEVDQHVREALYDCCLDIFYSMQDAYPRMKYVVALYEARHAYMITNSIDNWRSYTAAWNTLDSLPKTSESSQEISVNLLEYLLDDLRM